MNKICPALVGISYTHYCGHHHSLAGRSLKQQLY
jgi:hypothetical protein